MRIKSVKLVKDGYEGVKVEYIDTIEKMGIKYDVYKDHKYTHPISEELEDSFEKLKIHLLKLVRCWSSSWNHTIDRENWKIDKQAKERENVSMNEIIGLLSDFSVTSIVYNGEQFSMNGKMKSVDNRDIIFSTGGIKPETDYDHYADCVELIKELYNRTEDYINKEFVRVPTEAENGVAELVSKNPERYEETTVTSMPFYDL